MVSPTLTTPGERRRSHHKLPERRSYEVMEVVDLGVTWMWLDHDIEGLGRLSVRDDIVR
jgi:hypothetical protein